MEKYNLLKQQLCFEGIVDENHFFTPPIFGIEPILKVHHPAYVDKLLNLGLSYKEARATGFPQSAQLINREFEIANGTLQCALFALKYGFAFNIAGGTHHAYTDRGEGFCLLNDQAIAAQYLIDHGLANKVLIIDLDVHQGNGTAEIFTNSLDIITVSVHGKNNYPLRKEISHYDLPLEDHCEDEEYLAQLKKLLLQISQEHVFDFAFYQAGVDVLKSDKLGRLGLSVGGCKTRDQVIFEFCKHYELPSVTCMGGGYSPEINQIIKAHKNTFETAINTFL
ncbi:MAG: histone deacetylase [Cyclobacteriaceae bacterium]